MLSFKLKKNLKFKYAQKLPSVCLLYTSSLLQAVKTYTHVGTYIVSVRMHIFYAVYILDRKESAANRTNNGQKK